MPPYLFSFSGEYDGAAFSELNSIIMAEGLKANVLMRRKRYALLDCDRYVAKRILKRACLTKYAIEVKGYGPSYDEKDLIKKFERMNWDFIGDSFCVRVSSIGIDVDTLKLQRELGAIIKRITGKKVDLERPDRIVYCLLFDDGYFFGEFVGMSVRKDVLLRRPSKRPMFHPSSMDPICAHLMVNLSEVNENRVFMDPFCGMGGLLIESCMVGAYSIGVDVKAKMIYGARKNLEYYSCKNFSLIIGNSSSIPVKEVDCIATDPPYGRAAPTLGLDLKTLYSKFVEEASSTLKKGGKMVIALPKEIPIEDILESNHFEILEKISIYVHRSLTRKIIVCRLTY
ncbi:MAG: methyltransferase [Candidatus Odinarchaeota archaeon]|nr:methyltransferase [Candidatus Odinarchaeota archaeon]